MNKSEKGWTWSLRGPVAVLVLAGAMAFSACTQKGSQDPVNTIHLQSIAKIKGLDPAVIDGGYETIESSYAYESLLQFHYLKRPYVLTTNLAEAMPEVSKDGKVYTIRIKKGVLFQDDPSFKETGGKGRELVADDFIYSWKRLADPKVLTPNWWILDGKVAGINAWHDEAAKSGTADYSKPVEGLKALDRYTLQITLVKPNAQFIYMLAQNSTAAVAREAVEHYGKEFLNHAVGTGPYRLTEYNGNTKIIWDRNPTYRKELYPSEGAPGDKEAGLLEDAGQPLPRNDRIVTTIYEEQQPMWLNFLTGKLDVTWIPKDNNSQAIAPGNKDVTPEFKERKIRLSVLERADTTHLTFNMADPIVGKNKYLRQALSLTWDAKQLIQLFYSGRALPAQGPIPPGLEGYDPNLVNPYRQFNVVKAKELLAKAGYPDGKGLPPLEYLTMSTTLDRQWTEYTQKAYAQIGVQLKVSTYSWPEFIAKLKQKAGQIWEYAWIADYPDAENYLQLFYSKNASPGPNDSNYSNPEYDKLYEAATTEMNPTKRLAIYKQMVAILVEDCPWMFEAHRTAYYLSHPWVKGYKPQDFEHSIAKYYRVDPALKPAQKK